MALNSRCKTISLNATLNYDVLFFCFRCFLSAETKPIAAIIRNILQCAIDLSSCFTRVGSNPDKLTLHSLVNFPEVSIFFWISLAHYSRLASTYWMFSPGLNLYVCEILAKLVKTTKLVKL